MNHKHVGRIRQDSSRTHRFSALLFSMALWGVVSVGCGLSSAQLTGIEKFSTASAELADFLSEQFISVRADVMDLRKRMKQLGTTGIDDDFDGALDLEQVQVRVQALETLEYFAELLLALSTEDYQSRLQAASGRFLDNLRKVEGVQLSPERSDAIGKLVSAVGGMLVDYYRKVAVRGVVVETKESVERLVAAIAADFALSEDPDKLPAHSWLGVLQEVERNINNTLAKRIDDQSPEVQRMAFSALQNDATQKLADVQSLTPKVRQALATFHKAHNELNVLIQTVDFTGTDLDRYTAEVQEVVRLVKILRD